LKKFLFTCLSYHYIFGTYFVSSLSIYPNIGNIAVSKKASLMDVKKENSSGRKRQGSRILNFEFRILNSKF
jgi:hypothetical protein